MLTTYVEALRQALWEEMERDPNVFVLGEDVGVYGGAFRVTEGFYEHFGPKRVVDTPISEAAIVGAAIGASYMGLRPVAEMQFADFISCAFDQLVTSPPSPATVGAPRRRSWSALPRAAESTAGRSTRRTLRCGSCGRPA